MPDDPDLIERAAIAARTAFENVAPESGAEEWASFKKVVAAPPPLKWVAQRVDAFEEISCWTRVARAVLAVRDGEIERLRQALGAMTANLLGMRDGALVRDQAAEIERLRAKHDAAWLEGAEAMRDAVRVSFLHWPVEAPSAREAALVSRALDDLAALPIPERKL